MEMVNAISQAIEITRPEIEARQRALLAELNIFFGTPLELNADGELEVTPQQFALMAKVMPLPWVAGMRYDDIPLLVVEPPC